MTGARGKSFADVARSSGAYGASPGDSDLEVGNKFADFAISENPGFQGPEGPPGSSPYSNLRDYSGEPTGAPADSALQGALSQAATVIVLPSTSMGATWYFGTQWPIDQLAGKEIEVPQGVVVSHPNDIITAGASGGLIKYRGITNHYFRNLKSNYASRPESSLPVTEKSIFIGNSGPDYSKWRALNPTVSGQIAARKILWPNSDTWSDDTFSTTASDSYSYTPANDANFHVGFARIKPGERLVARPQQSAGSPVLTAIIRYVGGFVGITADQSNIADIQKIGKATGSAATTASSGFNFGSTHSSYEPRLSEWSIVVDTFNRCSVLLNGVVVSTFKTPGPIFEAGFGLYAGSNGINVTWSGVTIGEKCDPVAGRFFSVLAVGDSRTARRDGAWIYYARNALDLSFGIRNVKFDTIAVPGHSSGSQLSVLQTTNLTGINHGHIDIGTNDVQGGVPLETFVSNIKAMADIFEQAGCTVSFSVFDLWYTRDQAGSDRGQAAVNYDRSAPYRSAIRRLCAERGYKLVDKTVMSGPVVANYVNPALTPNLTASGNSIHFDNIHPTSLYNRVYGEAVARAIAGTLFEPKSLNAAPTNISAANGWATSLEQPYCTVSENGEVSCFGVVNDPGSGTRADNTLIAVLPSHVRPRASIRVRAVGQNPSESGFLIVGAEGEIRIFGFPASAWVDLSSVKFSLV